MGGRMSERVVLSMEDVERRAKQILATRHGELSAAVRSCVSDVLGIDIALVSQDGVVIELGAQSLDFIQLVFRLESMYGVELPVLYAIPDRHTIETYVEVLARAIAGRTTGVVAQSDSKPRKA
jgi:acyl carrier protein